MSERQLLVFGEKTFKINVPEGAKVTFSPFSPPSKQHGYSGNPGGAVGTLRIYQGSKDNIIAMFTGVRSFRDLTMGYEEEVAREEGAIIWNSDKDGYRREEKVRRRSEWQDPADLELNAGDVSDDDEGETVPF